MFIPKIKISPSQTPKWYTSNIHHQIKCLRTLRNKCKCHPNDHNHLKVQTAKKELQNSIQAAKVGFEATLVQDFAFNKYFYSVFVQSTYSLPPLSHNPSITFFSLSSINISEEEMYYALDPHKAFVVDGISPALFKHCASVLTRPLHFIQYPPLLSPFWVEGTLYYSYI